MCSVVLMIYICYILPCVHVLHPNFFDHLEVIHGPAIGDLRSRATLLADISRSGLMIITLMNLLLIVQF